MSMTRKDFEILAETIATLDGIGEPQRRSIATHFARELQSAYPNFNSPRFTAAATTVRWVVRCEDGKIRHERSFESITAAEHFAEWEHACTTTHTLVRASQRLSPVS